MKKFKLTWDERVIDHDGDFLYMEEKNQIVEAKDEDTACDQWEKENEYNPYQNGLSDCVEIVEHELFKKHLIVSMPDGLDYAVPVELIARDRAQSYADEFGGDIAESLREDTIPLFKGDDHQIRDWAANNMNWSDVKDKAIMLKKRIDNDGFEDAWCNGEWRVA